MSETNGNSSGQMTLSDPSLDLATLSNEAIVRLFENALKQIFMSVAEACLFWKELQRRGYDMAKLRRLPAAESIRQVAEGILAKEAVAAFYGRNDILRAVAHLSIEKQIELVEVGQVEVYDKTAGQDTHRLVEIPLLSAGEVRLVFDRDERRVRDASEQKVLLSRGFIKEKMVRAKFSHDENGYVDVKHATGDQIRAYLDKHGL
jgi:hypothetical protein